MRTKKTGCLVVEEKGVYQDIVEYADSFLGCAVVVTPAAGNMRLFL